jgi:hypothetical protein
VNAKPDRSAAFGELEGEERRRLARLGGLLFLVGSVTALPAGLLLEPVPALHEHLVLIAGAIAGAVILSMPWERFSSIWLHVLMIVGTIEVAVGVAVFSLDYGFFYVLVAMYAAYLVRDRTILGAYMAFFTAALLAPSVYEDANRDHAHLTLIVLPVMLITAFVVRYLRDTLERREAVYRGMALEAVALAERIRGTENSSVDGGADGIASRLEHLQHTPDEGLN